MSALPNPPTPLLTPEEYLRQERLAPFRSEYHGGRVVAMAGAPRPHNRIAGNVFGALYVQLKDRPCNNYGSDTRVSVRGGERYYYPDGVVTCGREEYEDDKQDVLLNPLVIIEVLSPSTEAFDRGRKFFDYQTIPSLREYVLVWHSPRRIEVYRRLPDHLWRYESFPFSEPPIVLESIACTLNFDEVYAKVDDEDHAGDQG